ncbi:MAG: T9SS type A sorting domain-containing protein, partial [Muribaculaceae bacterium]|nr:T9SS type A sorting domain-containing protein [Muribaculaceae bacterium]
FSQYRIHLSPVPVTAGSGSVSNNGTSQSKTITWTKGSGTTPVGYNVEVSTDGGTTWAMAASAENVTTESWTDTDTSRATLDCKYRVSAVYDSYTSTERHASAPCAVITVNAQRPTKAVSGVVVTFNPLIGTSTYNSTADLVGLEGSLSWTRPKSITSDSQSFPATATGDYGFGITGYRITVAGSDSSYATDESGNSLNAFTVAATGAMASDNLSMTLKNVKRGVTYTATVEPVYSYLPTSAASYGTSASAGNTWSYTPEAVQNFTVNTYVQRNAPFNEWWTDHTQTVYYDIYRVEITLDGPEAAGVPVSYYKLEVSRDNGSTWEPITDRPYEVASGQSGATSTTYPSYDGMPAGCWHGNHDFSVRTKPDAGFANNVNVGFYHFVVKGLSPAAPYSISPRAAEEPTPDEWQYRVTTYYGSSPSATYAGQTVTPDAAGAGSSSSVVITEVSDPTITSVEPVGIQPVAVKVYPNPTQGALNILSPEPIETIRIVSISGALMRTFNGNHLNSQAIDISDLGHGNYFVIVNALKPVAIIRN